MIRVLLTDDHAIIREGIRSLLVHEDGITVVGEANNGRELLALLETTPADVVLMDINMPEMDGLTATQLVREQYPDTRVLVLSMLDHPEYIQNMLAAGATGYVLKNAGKDEITFAIRTVAAGRPFLCSELGFMLLSKVLSFSTEPQSGPPTKPGGFSRREIEVLKLLAEGLTTNEIADKLFTSRRTIETHRQNIIEKAQVKNTAALIKYAATQGLI
ncbi:response regulator transcription factor [Hymenobacter lutimineralis]|uniref:Response regulator transcription factor n=1 Tax=Hymenobacter lutimineralis TaxID=2606448 RepID=A0A5D6V1V2_9BACT|nr:MULTISPECIES: response regulator transcription factor [Hymenobacter]QIX61732.1 response regulator transcription factor [Hymenobacter sp. BT18]TYZ09277.1 response regulator transcription factor [Hymenobacter lutimineralis]